MELRYNIRHTNPSRTSGRGQREEGIGRERGRSAALALVGGKVVTIIGELVVISRRRGSIMVPKVG